MGGRRRERGRDVVAKSEVNRESGVLSWNLSAPEMSGGAEQMHAEEEARRESAAERRAETEKIWSGAQERTKGGRWGELGNRERAGSRMAYFAQSTMPFSPMDVQVCPTSPSEARAGRPKVSRSQSQASSPKVVRQHNAETPPPETEGVPQETTIGDDSEEEVTQCALEKADSDSDGKTNDIGPLG